MPMQLRWMAACVFFVSILLVNCASTNEAREIMAYKGWGFSAQIPRTLEVREESSGPDFKLYVLVAAGEKELLAFYVGNHPDCPQVAEDLECEDLSETPGDIVEVRWSESGGKSREGVINLPQDFPAHLHFWYEHLDTEQSQAADLVIRSIQDHARQEQDVQR